MHGHVPVLSDMIAQAATDPEIVKYEKEKGTRNNRCRICCTALEVLIRRGMSPEFLQQELAIITAPSGFVDCGIY